MPSLRQAKTTPCPGCGGHFLHYTNCTIASTSNAHPKKGKPRNVFHLDPQSDN